MEMNWGSGDCKIQRCIWLEFNLCRARNRAVTSLGYGPRRCPSQSGVLVEFRAVPRVQNAIAGARRSGCDRHAGPDARGAAHEPSRDRAAVRLRRRELTPASRRSSASKAFSASSSVG